MVVGRFDRIKRFSAATVGECVVLILAHHEEFDIRGLVADSRAAGPLHKRRIIPSQSWRKRVRWQVKGEFLGFVEPGDAVRYTLRRQTRPLVHAIQTRFLVHVLLWSPLAGEERQ